MLISHLLNLPEKFCKMKIPFRVRTIFHLSTESFSNMHPLIQLRNTKLPYVDREPCRSLIAHTCTKDGQMDQC